MIKAAQNAETPADLAIRTVEDAFPNTFQGLFNGSVMTGTAIVDQVIANDYMKDTRSKSGRVFWKRRCTSCFVVFGLVLACQAANDTVLPSQERGAQASPEDSARPLSIFSTMRGALARLTSIEYESTYERTTFQGGTKQKSTHKNFDFAWQGNNFYTEFDITHSDSNTPVREKSAFNGTVHQTLLLADKKLELASKLPRFPYQNLQPFMFQFLFLHDPSKRLDMGTVVEQEAWDRVASRAKLVGRETVNGHPCEKIDLRNEKPGMSEWVYAATDLDYYPLKIEAKSAEGAGETIVTKFMTSKTPQGRVIVPLEILGTTWNAMGEVTTKDIRRILPATLHVNRTIPLERFTIAKNEAEFIRDIDAGTTVSRSGVAAPKPRPSYQWLVWAGAGFLVVAICIWWLRRRTLLSA